MNDVLTEIKKAVIEGNDEAAVRLTEQALKEGLSPSEILDNGLVPGMDVVGDRMDKGTIFIPEVLLSARAMKASLEILRPLLAKAEAKPMGKVVMGTVKGDLHDIGKSLVCMMLEGAGFEVIDLGKDVAPEVFVEAVKKEKPDIVGMSALLTTTMRNMGITIKALEEAGLRDQVKIMIGGAAVSRDFAEKIGADGYAHSAPAGVVMAREFIGS